MPQPQGAELDAVRARRADLKEKYLKTPGERPASVENRDYAGSSHFFFDIGNHNLLGFFDFPGHHHTEFSETIGAVQHLALSTSDAEFAAARRRLDEAGIAYIGPDRGLDNSLYIRDPNGVGIEFYAEELGRFEGEPLLGA